MQSIELSHRPSLAAVAAVLVGVVLALAMGLIFLYAPQETTMGDVQRIVYLHVAVAWCGLAGCAAMGVCGAIGLIRRDLAWDRWSQAAGEIGWLCATLTLATGSLWAHEAWNTWWTWEPRLTASLVLWTMYGGYFLVRVSIDDPERRARIAAVLTILAMADLPMVIMATRWFRGIHPVAPEMDPHMRLTLLASVVAFTGLFAVLTVVRQRQLTLAWRVASIERQIGLIA
jgi:heme exporter protein C